MKANFYLDDFNLITTPYSKELLKAKIKLLKNGEEIKYKIDNDDKKISLTFNEDANHGDHFVVVIGNHTNIVKVRFITHTRRFDEVYVPDLNILGSFFRKNTASFRLWAPFSDRCFVVLNGKKHEMSYTTKGVWEFAIKGFYERSKYHFEIIRDGVVFKFKDPFSYSCVKGEEESYLLDLRKLEFKNIKMDITTDPVIYELSIRDFSSDLNAPFKSRKKFNAFLEKGLTINDKPVGTDYLASLGVSHIQLMPIQTFDLDGGEYNWGYNPTEFNTIQWDYVEGNDAYSPIVEFRNLVDHLHKNNLKVTLDVVYNHVFRQADYAFEKCVPYYFFRYEPDGRLGNASGCGNELRSESKFFREYILLINKRLVNIFDIDGLRFDLMGILDIDTVNLLNDELKGIKRDFLMYGEGWHMGDIVPDNQKASMYNASKMPEFIFFNNFYRDALKGGFGNMESRGYAFGDKGYEKEVKDGLSGSFDQNLGFNQTLNYVECHDNITFYDKISTFNFEEETLDNIVKFALGLVVFAKGIPFIHSGQEFKRSKQGVENSYNSPDHINKIDWTEMSKNYKLVSYFKELLKIRKANPIFKLNDNVSYSNFYDTLIFSISNLDILINATEYTQNYYGDIVYKKILLPNGEYIYEQKDIAIEPFSLLVCQK